jgi:hypothetical protein
MSNETTNIGYTCAASVDRGAGHHKTGGSKTVSNGDSLSVTYTATAA